MKSPLFISSIELLAHATELFGNKNDKKYKFIILHLANSVELILKDKLLNCGHSIYSPKNQNLTLSIWDTFTALDGKGISIPEKPIIELLVDDRNTIQHRFGFPNEESVFYYLSSTKDFFQRFLKDEYGFDLLEELKPHLTNGNLELLGLTLSETHNLKKLKEVSPEMAIIQVSSDIEREANKIFGPFKSYKDSSDEEFNKNFFYRFFDIATQLLLVLSQTNFISPEKYQEISTNYKIFREIRNQISHGAFNRSSISKEKLDELFNYGIEIFSLIQEAKNKGIFTNEALDKAFAK